MTEPITHTTSRNLVFGSKRRRTRIVALAALLLATAGCAGVESETAPADAMTLEQGARLYQAHCAECHGTDLRGTDKGPSHLSEVYRPSHHGDGAFLLAVRRGVPQHHWDFGDMAPIEALDEEQVTAIVAFVRAQQDLRGLEPYPP